MTKKNTSKQDSAELLVKDIKEVSSAFSTSLDSFFDDVTTGIDRIFSNDYKNINQNKKTTKESKK